MNQEGLSRRFLYGTFLIGRPLDYSDKKKIVEIEEYARNNGAIVRENVAKLFVSDWKSRWNKCHRNRNYLESRFGEWLDQPLFEKQRTAITAHPSEPSHIGRRPSDFEALSESQKRRRTTELRKEESETLTFAASCSLRKEGNFQAAKLVKEAVISPRRAGKILTAYNKEESRKNARKMSDDEVLALATDCGLTKHQYLMLRKNSKHLGADSYPSYQKLLEAKSRCYPKGINITEHEALVNLQYLLDHTASRLISSMSEMALPEKVIIYYKWGFDGSSGHAEFRQVFDSASGSDSSVVITTLVPVRMICESNKSIIWENPTASSTRYCRPIRIAYEKESTESIKREYERLQAEIASLTPTHLTSNNISLIIDHKLFITMIDGKTVNALQNNKATSRCYICNCGPSGMNNLTNINSRLDVENRNELQYGISPLHARIKFFEYLLHISYRLHLPGDQRKKGARKTCETKQLLENRKKEIQDKFRRQLGLIVDMPKPGFGSSNDGNTARKFFGNTQISSEITGIDESLIHRFSVILTAINTSQQLDPEKFGDYASETAKIVVDQYNWFPMSPTVHKVLIHGAEIISYAILPLGTLSEEAMEHRNKEFKIFRSQFARRHSRISNLTDVFNRFLQTSDPLITHLRASTKKNIAKRELPEEVQQLLKLSENDQNENTEFEEGEDEII